MSEEEYNVADILDKKDFAVYLNEEVVIEDSFFKTETMMITSYLEPDMDNWNAPEETVRDLVSEIPKGIIHVPDSYFHYFSDFVGPITAFLEECIKFGIPKVEVISVVLEPDQPVVKNFSPFLEHCLSKFSDKIEVIYTPIVENGRLSDIQKPFIRINNFRVIDQRDIGISIDFLYDSAKTFAEHSDTVIPSRKVFIARRNDLVKDSTGNRHLYEEDVESLLAAEGFEVISGEMFESLKDQMKYFEDVSVFAGFSGSGLTSSMFMKPCQTVIEIVCPLKFDNSKMYELHNFYKTISMLKWHSYIAVSNVNNNKQNLLNQLKNVIKTL